MERFFDAPDKKPASKKSEESENEDETKPGLSDKDSDEKVITISIKLTRFIYYYHFSTRMNKINQRKIKKFKSLRNPKKLRKRNQNQKIQPQMQMLKCLIKLQKKRSPKNLKRVKIQQNLFPKIRRYLNHKKKEKFKKLKAVFWTIP